MTKSTRCRVCHRLLTPDATSQRCPDCANKPSEAEARVLAQLRDQRMADAARIFDAVRGRPLQANKDNP
jgi:hypothetical protein